MGAIEKVRPVLEKQLNLLSEQSEQAINVDEVCDLTAAMTDVCRVLLACQMYEKEQPAARAHQT